MPADTTLQEFCDLLLTATRRGLLVWQPGVTDGVVTTKLGKNYFILNATELPVSPDPDGDDRNWRITLDVRESASASIYAVTLDGSNPEDLAGIRLLRTVWAAATTHGVNATDRLRPVVESLRSAIAQAQG